MMHPKLALVATALILAPCLVGRADADEIEKSADLEIRVGERISKSTESLEAFGAVDNKLLNNEPLARYCYRLETPPLTLLLSELSEEGTLTWLRIRNSDDLHKIHQVSYSIDSLRITKGRVEIEPTGGSHKVALIHLGMDKTVALALLKRMSAQGRQLDVNEDSAAALGLHDQFDLTLSFSDNKEFSRVVAIQLRNSKPKSAPISIECLDFNTLQKDFGFLMENSLQKE